MFLVLLIAPLIAGLYGILHDQVTYTICPEYYTKFKFYQFRLVYLGNEAVLPNPRFYVALTGFMATWWTGLVVAIVQGLIGFMHPDPKKMFRVVLNTILLPLITTFVMGIIGFFVGKFMLYNPNWYFPNNLIDKQNFIIVGSIHNFSYLGGLLGLILGIIYQFKNKKT